MKDIKNKYFPLTKKKSITITFEADKEEYIQSKINLLKSAITKDNTCPEIKYTIKENQ
jgi:hypothetical protein